MKNRDWGVEVLGSRLQGNRWVWGCGIGVFGACALVFLLVTVLRAADVYHLYENASAPAGNLWQTPAASWFVEFSEFFLFFGLLFVVSVVMFWRLSERITVDHDKIVVRHWPLSRVEIRFDEINVSRLGDEWIVLGSPTGKLSMDSRAPGFDRLRELLRRRVATIEETLQSKADTIGLPLTASLVNPKRGMLTIFIFSNVLAGVTPLLAALLGIDRDAPKVGTLLAVLIAMSFLFVRTWRAFQPQKCVFGEEGLLLLDKRGKTVYECPRERIRDVQLVRSSFWSTQILKIRTDRRKVTLYGSANPSLELLRLRVPYLGGNG